MDTIEEGGQKEGLFVADKEHYTKDVIEYFCGHPSSDSYRIDILMPAPQFKNITSRFAQLQYTPLWAGYALGVGTFQFDNSPHTLQLIVQRQGERPDNYSYKPFLTTSHQKPVDLLTKVFPER